MSHSLCKFDSSSFDALTLLLAAVLQQLLKLVVAWISCGRILRVDGESVRRWRNVHRSEGVHPRRLRFEALAYTQRESKSATRQQLENASCKR